jgi:hypothetical protein
LSVGLSGNLRDFGIADVFQLIGQQRKTGVLELSRGKRRVQLVFDRGGVVVAFPAAARDGDSDPLGEMMARCGVLTRQRVAEATSARRSSAQAFGRAVVDRGWLDVAQVTCIEDLLTRDTIFEVLRWESGSFDFRAQAVSHDRDPGTLLGAEQILMDGLRMVDEWQSFTAQVPSDEMVFEPVGSFETYRDSAGTVSADQLESARTVHSLVDGRLPARRIVDLSRLGTFDGTRILAELRSAGLVEPVRGQGGLGLRRHARAIRSSAPRLSGGVATSVATAVCVLALLASAVFVRSHQPDATPLRIEPRSLERLREAYATRRLRNAMDAYRLAEGDWPASLDGLVRRGYLGAEALAAPEGRPYYSANRDDGVVLLAPEY